MRTRGPAPALLDNDVLRIWWKDGAWDKLAPVLEQLAQAVAFRLLHCGDDAADIAQGTLVRCWQSETVPDTPAAFVQRVARNLALDRMKRATNKYEVRDDHAEAEAPERGPLEALMMTDARDRLRMALRLVPEHLRRPLVLHVFHQRTMVQLAAQFQTTEGAMKMRLVRARTALREVYDDDARPPALADLKLTTHAKRHGTIEVRAFLPLASHDHRIGTWCLPIGAWNRIRSALDRGFALGGMALQIDDTHAARHGAAPDGTPSPKTP